jgi:hypothetical protein
MGLRQVFMPRDSDELRALPYIQKEVRAQNVPDVTQQPPRVYKAPPEWLRTLTVAVFAFGFYVNLILR